MQLKNLEDKYYTTSEMKKLFHVTNATLCRWRQMGRIHAAQPTNKRFLYPKDEVDRLLGLPAEKESPREIVLYCRVSTHAQKPHLDRQRQLLQDYCSTQGMIPGEVLSEIASGMNDNRKQFLKLVDMVLANRVKAVVVTYKDRLTRFGFDFYKWLFARHGCEIVVINNPVDQESTEQEMTDDLVAIIHHFSTKMYSARRNQLKKCRDALKEAGSNGKKESAGREGNRKQRVPHTQTGDK